MTAIDRLRRRAAFLLLGLFALVLAGCAAPPQPSSGGGGAQVAMLLPYGVGDPGVEGQARAIENAARLAIADLSGAEIDLRVYSTAGDPARAAQVARQAVDEGADVIVGPLFSEAANAAGQAVAGRGVNVLSLSNNAEIAGGNVFVLGYTFGDIARRVVGFAAAQGRSRIMIVYPETSAGAVARDATVRADRGQRGDAGRQPRLSVQPGRDRRGRNRDRDRSAQHRCDGGGVDRHHDGRPAADG